jgi:XTP/dITP diphosphohydrolase
LDILLATTNKGKKREFEEFFKDLEKIKFYVLEDLGIKEGFIERGRSFEEIAIDKAKKGFIITKLPTVGEDSGLIVPYLYTLPGIYSKRFSVQGTDEHNRRLLLKKLEGVSFEKRRALFVCVIAFTENGKDFEIFKGEVEGFIIFRERGSGGFGYDPLFLYPYYGKTFAELSMDLKNRVSHRGKALKAFKEFIKKRYEKSFIS